MTQERARTMFAVSLEVAMRIATPFLIGVAGWTFTNIIDHDRRLVKIEATTFTKDDARAQADQFNETVRQINDKLSELSAVSRERGVQMQGIEATLLKIREYIIANENGERRLP